VVKRENFSIYTQRQKESMETKERDIWKKTEIDPLTPFCLHWSLNLSISASTHTDTDTDTDTDTHTHTAAGAGRGTGTDRDRDNNKDSNRQINAYMHR